MAKKKKPKKRFVVGYRSAGNVVYGRDQFKVQGCDPDNHPDYCGRMTEGQARGALAQMPCTGATIFELVPVEL